MGCNLNQLEKNESTENNDNKIDYNLDKIMSVNLANENRIDIESYEKIDKSDTIYKTNNKSQLGNNETDHKNHMNEHKKMKKNDEINNLGTMNNSPTYNKNILTYIRIKDGVSNFEVKKNSIRVQNKTFYADSILVGPNQREIFELIKKYILEKAIKGYNCSIFAYGQTGSGKTYTIQGIPSNPGIIVEALRFLHGIYKSIKFSFIEIYNENLIDLFNPEREIVIRDDPTEGVILNNSTVIESADLENSLYLYRKGVSNRKTANTEMNANSSRSHSIFSIFLGSRDHGITKKSKICIVDLAGSEKYKEGEINRIKETCNINKSLLCLGNIVNKLSNKEFSHISYRDSKLTFILKDALGGNSKLAIIGNVNLQSPTYTVNTLLFLQRSKLINNNPLINYDTCEASVAELVENLKNLDEENLKLKEEIKLLRDEKKESIKGSVIFAVKELGRGIGHVKNKIEEIKKNVKNFTLASINDNKKLLLEINENLKKKSLKEKEEIRKVGQ